MMRIVEVLYEAGCSIAEEALFDERLNCCKVKKECRTNDVCLHCNGREPRF